MVAKLLFSILPNSIYYLERITSNKKPIFRDISECVEYIKAYQAENNLEIQFECDIRQLRITKDLWE